MTDPACPELGIKKVNTVEMCSPPFAKRARGSLPVVAEDDSSKKVDGYIHAAALPCEVAVHVDGVGYVDADMLSSEAIFTLFLTDVLFGEQMEDDGFAEAIQALPAQVNREIRTILLSPLAAAAVGYAQVAPPFALGPAYRSLRQVAEVVADTPYASPYLQLAYRLKDGSDDDDDEAFAELAFTNTDAKTVAEPIIATPRRVAFSLSWAGLRPSGCCAPNLPRHRPPRAVAGTADSALGETQSCQRHGRSGYLLHGHGLGQVARLIDVGTLQHRRVIGKQLQRHGEDDRCDELIGRRHAQHLHPWGGLHARVLIGEHQQLATAGTHLLEVRFQFLEQVVVRRHRDHRHAGVDQGEGTVLELAGRVGLGMDIGDLLEL